MTTEPNNIENILKELPKDHELVKNRQVYPINLYDIIENNQNMKQIANELIKLNASRTQLYYANFSLTKSLELLKDHLDIYIFLTDIAIIKYASIFKNSKYLYSPNAEGILKDSDYIFHENLIKIRDKVIAHQDKKTGFLDHQIWYSKESNKLYFPHLTKASLDTNNEMNRFKNIIQAVSSHIEEEVKQREDTILNKISVQN